MKTGIFSDEEIFLNDGVFIPSCQAQINTEAKFTAFIEHAEMIEEEENRNAIAMIEMLTETKNQWKVRSLEGSDSQIVSLTLSKEQAFKLADTLKNFWFDTNQGAWLSQTTNGWRIILSKEKLLNLFDAIKLAEDLTEIKGGWTTRTLKEKTDQIVSPVLSKEQADKIAASVKELWFHKTQGARKSQTQDGWRVVLSREKLEKAFSDPAKKFAAFY